MGMSLNNQLSLSRSSFLTFNTTQNQPNINVNLTLALDVFTALNFFFNHSQHIDLLTKKGTNILSFKIKLCVYLDHHKTKSISLTAG